MRTFKPAGPQLFTVVVQVGEYFYVFRKTQGGTMMRLLGECDNGKGGKSSFVGMTPIAVKKQSDLDYLQKYLSGRNKWWYTYKPKTFVSKEEAVAFLELKKNIKPTEVSLYVPSN